jgi:hypothetical protein
VIAHLDVFIPLIDPFWASGRQLGSNEEVTDGWALTDGRSLARNSKT